MSLWEIRKDGSHGREGEGEKEIGWRGEGLQGSGSGRERGEGGLNNTHTQR